MDNIDKKSSNTFFYNKIFNPANFIVKKFVVKNC